MGTSFKEITGIAAPFIEDGIDTDVIFPARFLLLMEKGDLGRHLFHDRRFGPDEKMIPDFVLNQPEFAKASILIARDNFGGGSSREHAVWSLAEYGIRCVVACGFGEIFSANCIRNGVLPARVDREVIQNLAEQAKNGPFTIDLATTSITLPDGTSVPFAISASDRAALLNGWDDIDQILALEAGDIAKFEAKQAGKFSWLYRDQKA